MKTLINEIPIGLSDNPYLDRPEKKIVKHSKKLFNQFTIGVLLVLALLYAGMQIEKAHYKKPLQGNEACRLAMQQQSVSLKANLDAQFGIPIPEGTPSTDEVAVTQKQCDATFQTYQIEVSK